MNKWASIFVLLLVVWALLYSFARNPSTPTLRPIAGRDHAPTEDPKSLNNQAVLYYEMGRNEDAKLLFIRALAISEQASGSDNFVTVSILNGLASVYQAMGRYEDAKPLFIRALAISEQANGPDHPDTGTRRRADQIADAGSRWPRNRCRSCLRGCSCGKRQGNM